MGDAGEPVAREAREEAADGDAALQARQAQARRTGGCRSRRPGAGCSRARDRAHRGRANCAGSRLAAPMHSVTSAPSSSSHAAHLARAQGAAVAELVGRFEAQEFVDRAASASAPARPGSGARRRMRASRAALFRGHSCNATSALPIRLVVVSCPAFRMKTQFCSSSASLSCLAGFLALDQAREHVVLGVARVLAALGHQRLAGRR